MSFITCIVLFILVVVIFPGIVIWISIKPREVLESPEFEQYWLVLYENTRLGKVIYLLYNLAFIIRRILFLCIAFYLHDQPYFQVIAQNLLNKAALIYQGSFNPLNR